MGVGASTDRQTDRRTDGPVAALALVFPSLTITITQAVVNANKIFSLTITVTVTKKLMQATITDTN